MKTAQEPSPERAEVAKVQLVPPRPNLGPEPFQEAPSRLQTGLLIGLAVLLSAFAAWAFRRRRAIRKRGASGSVEVVVPAFDQDDGTSGQLLRLAERIKESLIDHFGESWRAKTTEEMASDPVLASLLEAGDSEVLITLLRRADVLKFAAASLARPDADLDQSAVELAAWERSLAALLADKAGARSTIRGK